MATSEKEVIRVQHPSAIEGGEPEIQLKRQLGRGIYTQEVTELPNGDLEIILGNTTPRDLSDCRNRDNVLKFVTLRDVFSIRGKNTGEGYYHIRVPDREEVVEGIKKRESDVLDKLDYSMAQAIYASVYDLPDVRTQLKPILQLLRWVRQEGRTTEERLFNAQRSDNTSEYLNLLENLGYVDFEEGYVIAGEHLQSADLNEMGREEFGRVFLGDVVQRGYYTIRDQLSLSMLGHYQKYAGAYYFDAVQRGDYEFWLDMDTVQENLYQAFGERRDQLYIDEKLADLDRVDIVERDGEYVRGTEDVFVQVSSETPTV